MRLTADNATPVDTNDVFRWVFTSTGLWLVLSPFLMLTKQSAEKHAILGGSETLFSFGIAALLLAGFAYKKNALLQAFAGLALGLSLAVSPLIVGFTDQAASTWNAALVGVFLTLIAAIEIAYQFAKPRT